MLCWDPVNPNSAQCKRWDLDLVERLGVGPVEDRQEQLVTLKQYGLVLLLVPTRLLVCKGL